MPTLTRRDWTGLRWRIHDALPVDADDVWAALVWLIPGAWVLVVLVMRALWREGLL